MSGGNKKRRRKNEPEAEVQAALEVYGNAPVRRTFNPIGLDALGAQLQQGYGGPTDFLSMYQPMDMLQFMEPISTTQEQMKEGKYEPINTGNPFLDELLMKSDDKNKKRRRD